MGVALSFFPVEDERISELCASDRDCGGPDACRLLGLCMPGGAELCESDGDCAARGHPSDRCERAGLCASDGRTPCFVSAPADYCGPASCVEVGFCLDRYSCDASDYRSPTGPLEPLPASAPALSSRLAARPLRGATPTLPALSGALAHAKAWAGEHPSHKVIVVLATDGLPTVCGSADYSIASIPPAVAEVARVAADGAGAGIQTFVIGVFSPGDAADPRGNLDTVASSGKTGSSFLITTAEQVSERFLAALGDVRRRARSCEFLIPDAWQSVDKTRIGVRLAADGGARISVARVTSLDACAADGGFYFDGQRVILCRESCDRLESVGRRTLELSLDCRR
jgi:hypothetical protein